MKIFFLNYGGPFISYTLPIKGFIGMLLVTIAIAMIEAVVVYFYLRIWKAEIMVKDLINKVIQTNIITSLLGMPLIWLSPKFEFVPIILILCFILSVIIEQAILLWFYQKPGKNEVLIRKNTQPIVFDSVLFANIVSYLLLSILTFLTSFNIRKYRLVSQYLPELYFSFIFYLIGVSLIILVKESKIINIWTYNLKPASLIGLIFSFFFMFLICIPISYFIVTTILVTDPLFTIATTITIFIIIGLITLVTCGYILQEIVLLSYEDRSTNFLTVTRCLNLIINYFSRKHLNNVNKKLSLAGIIAVFFFSQIVILSVPSITFDWVESPPDKTLNLAIEGNSFSTLDIRWFTTHNASYFAYGLISQQIFGFLGMKAPGENHLCFPGIAEEWKHNSDGSYTFTLRNGSRFHNGQFIRARDVEYSWKAGMVINGQLDNLSDSKWINHWQFEYPMNDPDGNGLTFTIRSLSPDYNEYTFHEEFSGDNSYFLLQPEGSDYNNSRNNPLFCPISCGPYSFIDWMPNQYILLERFDEWFGWGRTFKNQDGKEFTFPKANQAIFSIKIRAIQEVDMRLMELEAGGIHWLYITNYTSFYPEIQETQKNEWVKSLYLDLKAGINEDIQTLLILYEKSMKNMMISSAGTIHFAYSKLSFF